MSDIRDVFDIHGGVNKLDKPAFDSMIKQELEKVALRSRGSLLNGDILPYIQGRSADKQGKLPLMLMSNALANQPRGFTVPALTHTRYVSPMVSPVGIRKAEKVVDPLAKGIIGGYLGGAAHENVTRMPNFAFLKELNESKNPEAFVDRIILEGISKEQNAGDPIQYLLKDEPETRAKIRKLAGKNPKPEDIRKARAALTKPILKTMSYDDKLTFVLPKVAFNLDAYQNNPSSYANAMALVKSDFENREVKALERLGMVDDFGVPNANQTPNNETLIRHLMAKDTTKRLDSLPFLDRQGSRFLAAHEFDHLRDYLDLDGGQFGSRPSPAMDKRVQTLSSDFDLVKRGLKEVSPTKVAGEFAADLRGFGSLADVTPMTPNRAEEGIPQFLYRGARAAESNPASEYQQRMLAMKSVFGSRPKGLPIRAFGALGAVGLLGLIAAGGAAAVASGGNRGNA